MREKLKLKMPFPTSGINVMSPRWVMNPETCINCQNVRVFDSLESRARGGIRPGLAKYCSGTFSGSGTIQDLNYVTTVRNVAPNTGALYIRKVYAAAVSNGKIQRFDTTTINAATSGGARSISATAPFVFSTELLGKLYFTDGISYKKWTASNNVAADWTATSGTLPGTDGTSVPRLIERYRGRIVLSGLRSDASNWFMSALNDPLNWDYSPNTTTETQAVTGGTGVVGKLGQPINCLIPYSDDVLLFGCDASIWQLSGDAQAGGRFDLITDKVGTAFGRPWTKDIEGNVYFFSSRGEIFALPPGGVKPQSLTADTISPLIANTNLNTHFIRMEWNQDQYGIHTFITPFTTGAATHWFYDIRSRGWFKDVFASNNYNPLATMLFDGDLASDRVMLIGSEDGRVRYFSNTLYEDDGTDFVSTVTLGPLLDQGNFSNLVLSEVQTVTDVNSNQVKIEILSDDTPEQAKSSEAGTFVGEYTMTVGLSTAVNPRSRGYAHFVKVGTNTATARWGLEETRVTLEKLPKDTGRIKRS